MVLLLMFAMKSLATSSSLSPPLSIFCLCDGIAEGKGQNEVAQEKIKCPVSIQGRGKPIIQPMQVMWSRFSTMPVWTQEKFWNRVLLERGTNPFVVWTGL